MNAIKQLGLLWIVLVILMGVLLGSGGYTFYEARGWSYLSNNPAACVNCHIMRDQYDGWQKGSHHAVANCSDCHISHGPISKWLVKAENGYLHSKAFTLQDFHEPIAMRERSHAVLVANCTDCHLEMVELIFTPPDNASQSLDCVRCHRDVGHGPTR